MRISCDTAIATLRATLADRRGAVTVDWVVLSAAAVMLSIGAIGGISNSVRTAATDAVTDAQAGVAALQQ